MLSLVKGGGSPILPKTEEMGKIAKRKKTKYKVLHLIVNDFLKYF